MQNWRSVIDSIQGPAVVREEARDWALKTLAAPAGLDMKRHTEKLRDGIPEDHPLRPLIVAQGG